MVKESGKQEQDSCSHRVCSQGAESNDHWAQISFFVFYSTQDFSPWYAATPIQGWSSPFSYTFLATLCYTYPEVCCHGDSKSNQVDKMNHHTWKANLEMEKSMMETRNLYFWETG